MAKCLGLTLTGTWEGNEEEKWAVSRSPHWMWHWRPQIASLRWWLTQSNLGFGNFYLNSALEFLPQRASENSPVPTGPGIHGILSISPLKASFNLVITLLLTYSNFVPQWRYSWRDHFCQAFRGAKGAGAGLLSWAPPANFSSPKAPFLQQQCWLGWCRQSWLKPREKYPSTCLISLCYFPSGVSLYNLPVCHFSVLRTKGISDYLVFSSSPFITLLNLLSWVKWNFLILQFSNLFLGTHTLVRKGGEKLEFLILPSSVEAPFPVFLPLACAWCNRCVKQWAYSVNCSRLYVSMWFSISDMNYLEDS